MMILLPRMTCKGGEKRFRSRSSWRFHKFSYHHSDVVLLSVLAQLECFIDDDVHEGIKTTEDSLHASASIELQRQFLVHVSTNINKPREMKTFSQTNCILLTFSTLEDALLTFLVAGVAGELIKS